MAESDNFTPIRDSTVYIRGQDGETRYLTVKEGLAHFLSDDGYRLTLRFEGVELVLRKETRNGEWTKYLDEHIPGRSSTEALVTIQDVGSVG